MAGNNKAAGFCSIRLDFLYRCAQDSFLCYTLFKNLNE